MKYPTLILLLLVTHLCSAQQLFKNESQGFRMQQPENWIEIKKENNTALFEEILKTIDVD